MASNQITRIQYHLLDILLQLELMHRLRVVGEYSRRFRMNISQESHSIQTDITWIFQYS